MEIDAYRLLYNNIHDFKIAAVHLESEIIRQGIDSVKHSYKWESMKAVSHFNLGIALELMLKMILLCNGKSLEEIFKEIHGKERHHLAVLYGYLPEEERKMLNSKFDKIFERKPMTLVAPIIPGNEDDPFKVQKNRFKRTEGSSLINFLTDFDNKGFDLPKKRYEYEAVEKGEWRIYLDDISAFTELIDCVLKAKTLTPTPRPRTSGP